MSKLQSDMTTHKAQENLDVNHKENYIFPLSYYDWNKLSHPQSQEEGKDGWRLPGVFVFLILML